MKPVYGSRLEKPPLLGFSIIIAIGAVGFVDNLKNSGFSQQVLRTSLESQPSKGLDKFKESIS